MEQKLTKELSISVLFGFASGFIVSLALMWFFDLGFGWSISIVLIILAAFLTVFIFGDDHAWVFGISGIIASLLALLLLDWHSANTSSGTAFGLIVGLIAGLAIGLTAWLIQRFAHNKLD